MVAAAVEADRADLVLGQVPALAAEADALLHLGDRRRERERLVLRRAEDVEGEPLRRALADARQRVSWATRFCTAGDNIAEHRTLRADPDGRSFPMAVVAMMKMSGDADELAAKLRDHVAPVGARARPGHGGLGTIVCRTDDGVMFINLWDNDEGRHAMAQEPKVLEALQAGGFRSPRSRATRCWT